MPPTISIWTQAALLVGFAVLLTTLVYGILKILQWLGARTAEDRQIDVEEEHHRRLGKVSALATIFAAMLAVVTLIGGWRVCPMPYLAPPGPSSR